MSARVKEIALIEVEAESGEWVTVMRALLPEGANWNGAALLGLKAQIKTRIRFVKPTGADDGSAKP